MKPNSLMPVFLTIIPLTIAGCDLDLSLKGDDARNQNKGAPQAVVFQLDETLTASQTGGTPFSPPQLSVQRFSRLMQKASSKLTVQEIVIHFGSLQVGLATTESIIHIIQKAAEQKPVTCLIESADNKTYFTAATACPKLLISPAGEVELIGLATQSVYLKDLLDEVGVKADMMTVGQYKSAAENVTRNQMSDPARKATRSLLTSITDHIVGKIAKARHLSKKKIIQLIDEGPYTAVQALKKGLVDEIEGMPTLLAALEKKYQGGVNDQFGKKPQKEMDLTDLLKLFSGSGADVDDDTPKIAIIEATGPISSGRGNGGLLGGTEGIYETPMLAVLQRARLDDAVKAVVLNINSPGGSARTSDNLYQSIKLLADTKPVMVVMGDVAASGGYYMAVAGHQIFARPTTITGSIGVVGGKVVFGAALDKLGAHPDGVTLGRRAAIMSPFVPFSDEERAVVKASMEQMYELFVKRVAAGRHMKTAEVKKVAQGRVWTGLQAKKIGLIDQLGGLDDAINAARKKVGKHLIAVVYPRPKSFLEALGEKLQSEDVRLQLISRLPAGRSALAMGALLQQERVLAFCPIDFSIE